MRVLFLQDVTGVALAGEVKEVKTGFARNYLLSKNLATLAMPENMKRVDSIKRVAEQRRKADFQDVEALASVLDGTQITIKAKASPSGQYYGAIGSSQIAEELSRVVERAIERKIIQLENSIKEPGSYEVALRLGHDVSTNITVIAEAEE